MRNEDAVPEERFHLLHSTLLNFWSYLSIRSIVFLSLPPGVFTPKVVYGRRTTTSYNRVVLSDDPSC